MKKKFCILLLMFIILVSKHSEADKVATSTKNNTFLSSTQEVNWNKENKAIILAGNLIEAATKEKIAESKNRNISLTETEKIDIIYSYIVKNIDYDFDKIDTLSYDYIPNIDSILKAGSGICYDYSVLFAAMLRSQGIPAKLVKGYSTTTDVYHAWNEIYLINEGRWIIIDTTYDAFMYKNNNRYTMEKPENQYTKKLEY